MQTSTERRLAEAKQELTQHERQRIILEKEVAALEAILGDRSHPQPPEQNHSRYESRPETASTEYGSKRHRMEIAIEAFLRQNGRPMHRMQIKDHLLQNRIIGDESNPLANVSNLLSTSKKFAAKGSGLWALTQP